MNDIENKSNWNSLTNYDIKRRRKKNILQRMPMWALCYSVHIYQPLCDYSSGKVDDFNCNVTINNSVFSLLWKCFALFQVLNNICLLLFWYIYIWMKTDVSVKLYYGFILCTSEWIKDQGHLKLNTCRAQLAIDRYFSFNNCFQKKKKKRNNVRKMENWICSKWITWLCPCNAIY